MICMLKVDIRSFIADKNTQKYGEKRMMSQ